MCPRRRTAVGTVFCARQFGSDRGGNLDAIYSGIAAYYSASAKKFGPTPLGVDWTCQATQEMRFVQLLKLCDFSSAFSLNDLGCGYGALVSYLGRRHLHPPIDYLGIDVSASMVRQARQLWDGRARVTFVHGHIVPRTADYALASGIFNVELGQPREEWEKFIRESLDNLHETSRRGFAVNFMKRLGGIPGREGLYYAEPAEWARYCANRFGAATELCEDYGMREFTLIVRKRNQAPSDNCRRASSNSRR
ncbi:SAM-dependent methyltransferase [Bradyrhizobium sp. RT6a]